MLSALQLTPLFLRWPFKKTTPFSKKLKQCYHAYAKRKNITTHLEFYKTGTVDADADALSRFPKIAIYLIMEMD